MTDFPTLRLCLTKFEEARTAIDETPSQHNGGNKFTYWRKET